MPAVWKLFPKKSLTNENKSDNIRNMKVGDLLTGQPATEGLVRPILVITEIKKHPSDSERDRICLQWMSRNGAQLVRGEFSRFIVENRYEVL